LNFGPQNFSPIARLLHTVRTLRPSLIWTGAAAVCPRPRQASASGRSPPASTYASRVRPRFSRTFDVRPQSRPLLPPSFPSFLSFLATSRTLATRRQTCPIDYPHTQICRNRRYPPRLRPGDHAECYCDSMLYSDLYGYTMLVSCILISCTV